MEQVEVWKDIKGYEGNYQVSDLGRVKSLARIVESRKGVFGNKKELILKTAKNRKGYLCVKHDNRVDNLEWVTSSENVIHSLENKLKIPQKGSEHGMSKLTEKEVLEIRAIGRTKTLKEVGKIYNVDLSLISLILLNKIWNHI